MDQRARLDLIWAAAAALLGACGGDTAGGGDDGGNVGFGGAQDIGQFRSILDQGEIPGEETLDANGFFAEHYSELPPADCGQNLCVNPMLAVGRHWLDGRYQATAQLALTTPIDPATLPRRPLDMVIVVDRSGSMAEDGRLDKVKDGLHLLIDGLMPGDRLGLIQFDTTVQVLSRVTDELDPVRLHDLVDALEPGAATNIHGGLLAGFQEASAAWSADRQSRVILLSDGLATAGVTDSTAIISMADSYITDGTSLSTIGVGLEFDVELMRGLAEHGAGNFYFLEDATAVTEVFTQELRTSLTTIATDVRVTITPADGVYTTGEAIGSRLVERAGTGYELTIPAVFVASREDQIPEPGRRGGGGAIFVDLSPIAGALGNAVATVELRYRLPGSTEELTQTASISNPYAPGETPPETYVSTQAMLEHYAMYNMYLGLREATRNADYRYDCALGALQATRDAAVRFNSIYSDPDIAADIDLIDQFMDNLLAKGGQMPGANGPTQAECRDQTLPPDDGYGDDDGGYDGGLVMCGCTTSDPRSGGGLVLIGLACAAICRRRRRR